VTGDLVRGASINDTNFVETIRRQYQEAKNFLTRLSDDLFEGDIGRVFVMPGNHDICWPLCKQSMEVVESSNIDVQELVNGASSMYRWSWNELRLCRITDVATYKRRLVFFKEFFDDFYKTIGHVFSLEDNDQSSNFVTPDEKALFTGFSSLYGNDCHDRRGRIFADNVARKGLSLMESELKDIPLKIAFWHHSLDSPEYGMDHLNSTEILPMLIDQGYVLALHGHRHRSGLVSYAYHLDPDRVMPIVSAGSLCASPEGIPAGYRRQYNVLEIDDTSCKAKLHVREWFGNTSFAAARLSEFGGKSWRAIDLPLLREVVQRPVQRFRGLDHSIDAAELLVRERKFDSAYSVLKELPMDVAIVRRLWVETLHSLGKWDEIISAIKMPGNPDELGVFVDALCRKKNFDQAQQTIEDCELDASTYDAGFLEELKKRVRAEREAAIGHG